MSVWNSVFSRANNGRAIENGQPDDWSIQAGTGSEHDCDSYLCYYVYHFAEESEMIIGEQG